MQVPRRTARASADDSEQRSLTDLHMLGQLNHHPNQAMAAISSTDAATVVHQLTWS
jgi:hypothetical protein